MSTHDDMGGYGNYEYAEAAAGLGAVSRQASAGSMLLSRRMVSRRPTLVPMPRLLAASPPRSRITGEPTIRVAAMLPVAPGFSLPMAELGFEVMAGLTFVKTEAKQALPGMDAMIFHVDTPEGTDPLMATVAIVLGQQLMPEPGMAWQKMQALRDAGNVIVIAKTGGETGAVSVAATKDPTILHALTNATTGTFAIIDGPTAIIATAQAKAALPPVGPGPIPGPPPVGPDGTTPTPAPGGMPSWVAPAAIGAGVVLAVAAIMMSRKPAARAAYATNRRRAA